MTTPTFILGYLLIDFYSLSQNYIPNTSLCNYVKVGVVMWNGRSGCCFLVRLPGCLIQHYMPMINIGSLSAMPVILAH